MEIPYELEFTFLSRVIINWINPLRSRIMILSHAFINPKTAGLKDILQPQI